MAERMSAGRLWKKCAYLGKKGVGYAE